MVVYIEYALAENFLIDGMLLWLSARAAKRGVRIKNLLLAAMLGAVFAVVFPVFSLPKWADYACKFAFAPLLCALAFGRIKTRTERRAFALFTALFFAFSFALAGMLFALLNAFAVNGANSYEVARAPFVLALCGGAAFLVAAVELIKRLYKKRAIERLSYDCEVRNGAKSVQVKGYYDSGNVASKNGTPVCFLAPDLVYDLWGDAAWQIYEELCITTVSGVKTVRLFKGVLLLGGEETEAYFSPAANMISREYKLLLNARILERRGTK